MFASSAVAKKAATFPFRMPCGLSQSDEHAPWGSGTSPCGDSQIRTHQAALHPGSGKFRALVHTSVGCLIPPGKCVARLTHLVARAKSRSAWRDWAGWSIKVTDQESNSTSMYLFFLTSTEKTKTRSLMAVNKPDNAGKGAVKKRSRRARLRSGRGGRTKQQELRSPHGSKADDKEFKGGKPASRSQ
jgi:hypothetical protein